MTSLVDEYRGSIPDWATHIGRDKRGYVLVFSKEPEAASHMKSFSVSPWDGKYDIMKIGGDTIHADFLVEEINDGENYEDADI